MRAVMVLVACLVSSAALGADPPKPKLGPEATPLLGSVEYLRKAPAPDYWMLSAFYVPQQTSSDCSAAVAAMAVNALRGLPDTSDGEIVTEKNLLDAVNDTGWRNKVVEDGPGVTFAEWQAYMRKSLDAEGLEKATDKAVHLTAADPAALAALRQALADNESSADDVMLVYFNQGVITGDWDGPHISPIGAYDATNDRVLIMDVDREWYVPYWTSVATLLKALVKPAPPDQGVLAGETGGYLVLTRH
jgi:hypothetical protein